MNAAKAVARINPHIHRFEVGISGFGAITDRDILLALSLITSEGARLMGRVLYAGQDEYKRDLGLCLILEVNAVAGRENWKDPEGETNRVCQVAMKEYLRARLCGYCKGQESVPDPANTAKKITCPRCKGQGGHVWGEATRARYAKMGRIYWKNHWSERYKNTVLPMLDKYHDIFWQGLARRLK